MEYNAELIMVYLPAISWFLFALGGTQLSAKQGGWKGWRRWILPAVFFWFCAFGYQVFTIVPIDIWRSLGVFVLAVLAFCMPMPDDKKWWQTVGIALLYGSISLPVGVSWWNLFTAIGFVGLFLLSNSKYWAKTFVWSTCSGFYGLLCGIQVAQALMFGSY